MTTDWFEQELEAMIRRYRVHVLLTMRAAIDAALATYQIAGDAAQAPESGSATAELSQVSEPETPSDANVDGAQLSVREEVLP